MYQHTRDGCTHCIRTERLDLGINMLRRDELRAIITSNEGGFGKQYGTSPQPIMTFKQIPLTSDK